ncbi:hypothetical protein [Gimesia sp.]|uniref:hypothetical protein n=1 Tax=Gimesia sp. TaxID=2024833 RepID=UPI0025BEB217|nr:hypothetical protein [Gimesia sp.]
MEGFSWMFAIMGFSMAAGAVGVVNQLTTQVKALEARIALLEAEPDVKRDTLESSE